MFVILYLQISSTCPVCVTYEARSKFIINSLRPAFAKIYPSTRPDLAVETFFHARLGSPLLRGITDDDFITWFDKTELASLQSTASIDNICECGRICSRDYEFRRNEENKSENATPSTTKPEHDTSTVTATTEEPTTSTDPPSTTQKPPSTTKMTTIVEAITIGETSTTEKPKEVTTISTTSTSVPTTKETSTSTTQVPTITDPTEAEEYLATNTSTVDNNDDPIIIPTITYVNYTEVAKIENNIVPLVPKPSGELIIQKLAMTKPLLKKEDLKKKPLPRRKGTLKATYGDKLFEKSKVMSNPIPSVNKIKVTNENFNNTKTEEIITDTKFAVALLTGNKSKEIIKISNNTNMVSKEHTHTDTSHKTKDHMETSTIPHTITAITNSNIKTIHYRTKKPKAVTQIKKPRMDLNHTNEIDKNNDMPNRDTKIINKTKVKTINTEKRTVKTLKSINKEIHKIPSTPISETSKSLSDTIKSDIAPENKGSFEILDKNNLWELLKEGPDDDSTKIDDKLQVHNRLNVLAPKVSNLTNDSRSL